MSSFKHKSQPWNSKLTKERTKMSNRSPLHITSFDSTQRSFFEYIFDPEYGNFKMKMLIQENPKEKEIPFHYPSWLVDKVSIFNFIEWEKNRLPIFFHYPCFAIETDYSCIEPIPDGHMHFLLHQNVWTQHILSIKLLRWNVIEMKFEMIKSWP